MREKDSYSVFGKCVPEKVVVLIFSIIILCITLFNIKNLNMIYVSPDEYGYWATAAHFAGYDWSNLLRHTSYYSYGYSLLITPLFWIFNNSAHMYKAAIVINGILLSGSFCLTYFSAKKLAKNINNSFLLILSFSITLYCNNILQANIAWSECLLYFLFWCIFWLCLKIIERPQIGKVVGLAVLTVYMVAVHQRSLGILVSVAIFMTLLKLMKYINIKQYIIFIGSLFICYMAYSIFKGELQNTLWAKSALVGGNDFSGQKEKVVGIFTNIWQFRSFIKGVIGMVFYLGVSSFFFAFWGIFYCLHKVIICIKNRIRKEVGNSEISMKGLLSIFLILSFGSTVVISAIFLLNGDRVDHLFYGRYNELLIGPLLMFGIIGMSELKGKIKIQAVITVLMISLAVLSAYALSKGNHYLFNQVCAVGLYWAHDMWERSNMMVYIPLLLGFGISTVYLLLAKLKKHSVRAQMAALLLIALLWFMIGIVPLEALNKNNELYFRLRSVTEEIVNNEEDVDVFFLSITEKRSFADWIDFKVQFVLPEERVLFINYAALSDMEFKKPAYFIISSSIENVRALELYQYCDVVGQDGDIITLRMNVK